MEPGRCVQRMASIGKADWLSYHVILVLVVIAIGTETGRLISSVTPIAGYQAVWTRLVWSFNGHLLVRQCTAQIDCFGRIAPSILPSAPAIGGRTAASGARASGARATLNAGSSSSAH